MKSKELGDQLAHIIVCSAALGPAAFVPNPFTFAWAGFCMGMVREVTEEGQPVTPAKVIKAVQSYRDLTFWTLGGLATGTIPMVMK